MQVAIVTGASRGLGLELVRELSTRGWRVVADARGADELRTAVGGLDGVTALAGDVTDDRHRRALVAAAGSRLDLLLNNASTLGTSPLPPLERYPLEDLERVFAVNVVAPLALVQLVLPLLAPGGVIVNISSDAGVEAYEGWGGYGASKSALDQLSRVLAAERPDLHVYAVDPGDMNTAMHQEAFPGEDISDRPLPSERVPGLLHLIETLPASGRYSVDELLAEVAR
jgi:NAD(P)-dependent dehydrogenase (short-subunit alcohol dehydrogenase family)